MLIYGAVERAQTNLSGYLRVVSLARDHAPRTSLRETGFSPIYIVPCGSRDYALRIARALCGRITVMMVNE